MRDSTSWFSCFRQFECLLGSNTSQIRYTEGKFIISSKVIGKVLEAKNRRNSLGYFVEFITKVDFTINEIRITFIKERQITKVHTNERYNGRILLQYFLTKHCIIF